jgi:hypothetical protein
VTQFSSGRVVDCAAEGVILASEGSNERSLGIQSTTLEPGSDTVQRYIFSNAMGRT